MACNSAWLDNSTAAAQRVGSGLPKKWTAADWRGDIEIIPRLPLDGPPSTHRCLVWYYYEEACDLQASAALNPCKMLALSLLMPSPGHRMPKLEGLAPLDGHPGCFNTAQMGAQQMTSICCCDHLIL